VTRLGLVGRRTGWWAGRPATRAHAGDLGSASDDRDRGNATVELAVSLPALVLLLYAGLTAVLAVRTDLGCVDAAREVARAVARGDVPATPLPSGGSVAVATDGDVVRATVHVLEHPLGGRLPGFEITATAVAAVEPTDPGP
jgi:hypothetical protein